MSESNIAAHLFEHGFTVEQAGFFAPPVPPGLHSSMVSRAGAAKNYGARDPETPPALKKRTPTRGSGGRCFWVVENLTDGRTATYARHRGLSLWARDLDQLRVNCVVYDMTSKPRRGQIECE